MHDLTEADHKLYDRQIRLFGTKTQQKIKNMQLTVMAGRKTYTAGEIIKNFALLGVCKITLNSIAMECYSNMVYNTLQEINENIECCVIDNIFSSLDDKNILKNFDDEIINNNEFDYKKCLEQVSLKNIGNDNFVIEENRKCDGFNEEKRKTYSKNLQTNDKYIYGNKIDQFDTYKIKNQLTRTINLENNIIILIDTDFELESAYYVCSNCLSYSLKPKHECIQNDKNCKVALECLLGAVFVQEIIKKIGNEKYLDEYKVDL